MADARPPKPDPEPAARGATALEYGATHVLALSQLSDLADLPDGSAGGDGAPPLPALPVGQSQEMLAVPSQFAPSVAGGSQPSQFAPASQVAFAAAPSFVEAGGLVTGGGARRGRTARERSPPARPPASSAPTSAPGDESDVDAATAAAVALASPRTVAAAVAAAAAVNDDGVGAALLLSPPRAHRDRRRGPMDEMRQLVRILVKLIPHSAPHVAVGDDGGGNRLSEDQIKAFLAATLGDGAPRPPWGVPSGWAAYLADLYTWVRGGARVSVDDASATARRDPGRSWEAVPSALARLGLHPRTWPLPLTEAGLAAAREHPIDQCGDGGGGDASGGGSAFASPAGKRRRAAPAADGGGAPPAAAPAPPAPRGATALDLRELDEAGLWRAAATALALAGERAGTTAPPALPALAALKAHVVATAARLAGDALPLVSSAPVSAAASPARPRLPERGAAPSPGGRKARGGTVTRAPSD